MSAHRSDNRIEEIVHVDPARPVEIAIENPNGVVLVRGCDRADILVRAEKHGNKSSAIYQETEFWIDVDGARVTISPVIPPRQSGMPSVSVDLDLDLGPDFVRDLLGPGRNRGDREQRRHERRQRRGRGFSFKWDNSDVSYEIEVEVPHSLDCRLGINTASGDVEVRDLTGAIAVHTASGDAVLTRLMGDIAFNTASGDLRIDHAKGQLACRSASGDARVERSAYDAFGFHSASGDVHLDAALTGDGPFRIETVSGDTRLAIVALNPDSGAERGIEVAFQTMSGDALLDRAFQRQGAGRWRWLAGGTEPGPRLAVTSVSGDLHGALGASPEARALGLHTEPPPMTPAPPAPPAPDAPAVPPAPSSPIASPTPPAVATAADRAETGTVHTGGLDDHQPAASAAADRLALLEAVERGEIDIEEALQRLEDRKEPDAGPA
ncbi:MAG: DUF4097 family beta strand repeat protein [Chloroflexia bacterium]|nr:DUF4097 family beta strand repeat protein [Chloroflexia bacterium]